MTDKLEALSQPVAWTDAEELAQMNAGTYADMFNGKHIQTGDGQWIALYSQEYVTALLAALEEKDQRIKELEQRLQQPIKLPKSGIGMACKFVGDHIVVSLAEVLVETAMAGFKAEVEGE